MTFNPEVSNRSPRSSGAIAAAHADAVARVSRGALVFTILASAVTLVAGEPRLAAGVLGGGLLSGGSLWAIRTGVDAVLERLGPSAAGGRARPIPWGVWARLVGRYALLAFGAYVMIARLRLHPLGLLVGASSVVVAASVESVRAMARRGIT
jgi:hypothetical protein